MTSGGGSHAASGSFARDVTKRVGSAVVIIVVVVVVAYVVFRSTRSSSNHTASPTTLNSLPSASVAPTVPSSTPATSTPVTSTPGTAPGSPTSGSTTSVGSTTAPASTTTLAKPPPGTVTAVVLNGTVTPGAARYYTNKLGAAGYQTLVPLDASASTATTSLVLVTATGTKAGAEAVAETLGLPLSAVVTALPASAPIPASDTGGTDVVVLIGRDLAAKMAAVATTTTAAASAGVTS